MVVLGREQSGLARELVGGMVELLESVLASCEYIRQHSNLFMRVKIMTALCVLWYFTVCIVAVVTLSWTSSHSTNLLRVDDCF